jgi:hypothetical protein
VSSDDRASAPEGPDASAAAAPSGPRPEPRAPRPRPGASPLAAWIEVAPLIVLAIATVLLSWVYAPLFRGELAGDDNTFHFAEVVRISRALRDGDLDWWNPSANVGFATGYYYQLVPAAVPGIFAAAFGHPLFWFQLGAFVPLVLVPLAAYRGLRVMGAPPWPAVAAAVAVAFASSPSKWGGGVNGVFLVGLYTQAWALCGFPLALGHGCRWLSTGRGLAPAVGWGVFVGLCHPVAGVALGGALVLAIVPMLVLARPTWAPPVRLAALGGLLLVASAPSWLPVIVDYAGFGGFPARVAGEDGPGFELLMKWLLDGYLFDAWRWPVISIGALLAIPAAFVVRRRPYLGWLAIATLGLGFVLGVGRSLRTADDLFPAIRVLGPLQITGAALVGALLVEAALWALRASERRWFATPAQLAAGVVCGLAAIAVVAPVLSPMRARVRVSRDFPAIHRAELDELLPVIRAAGPGRIQVRGVENHWFMLLPYVHADRPALAAFGGAALQSSPNFVYLQAGPDAWHAAWIYDAPLVLTTPDRGKDLGGELLASTTHFELRQLPAPGLVAPVQVAGLLPANKLLLRELVKHWQRSDQSLRDQVLVHQGHGGLGPPPAGEVRAAWRDGSSIGADVVARAPTTFAIRESWHPRWRIAIDGRAATVRRISPDLLAVDVPAGEHRIVARFHRPVWTWLLWLLVPLAIAVEPVTRALVARRRARRLPTATVVRA